MEQDNGLRLGELIKSAFRTLKRNIVLILAVILLVTGAGVALAYAKKPTYTATQSAIYMAEGYENNSGKDSEYTSAYFDTFIKFCNQGCVVDRANFYYDYYVKHQFTDVDEFIDAVSMVNSTEDELYYDATTDRVTTKYISEGNISVSASASDSQTVSYMVGIKYRDASTALAKDKVKILLCAIENEANLVNEYGQKKYFGVNVSVKDYEYNGVSSDWSKSKVIVIAFILGVILSMLAVYVVSLMDRTLRDKDDLERLTGSDLLAYIESKGV